MADKLDVSDFDGYANFIDVFFDELERQVMKIFREENTAEIRLKRYIVRKDISSFLNKISSLFNVTGLKDLIKQFVKKEYLQGVEDVEDELNLSIGIKESERELIDSMAEQQVEGHALPDGRKWSGIRGVTAEVQVKVGEAVMAGIRAGDSVDEMAKRVSGVFDATTSRAKTIARTEGNRIRNEAHNRAYMDSGIDGMKEWSAHEDSRISDVCKNLNGQKVPLDGVFTATNKDNAGEQFVTPPAHPNCRSRIVFVPTPL